MKQTTKVLLALSCAWLVAAMLWRMQQEARLLSMARDRDANGAGIMASTQQTNTRVWVGMTEPEPTPQPEPFSVAAEIAAGRYQTNALIWTVGPTNLPPVRLLYLHSGPPTTRPWGTIQMWTEEAAERTNFGMWHYQWESPKRWDMLTGDQVEP